MARRLCLSRAHAITIEKLEMNFENLENRKNMDQRSGKVTLHKAGRRPGNMLVTLLAFVLVSTVAAEAPWCKDPAYPALAGMYGDLGNATSGLVDLPLTDLPGGGASGNATQIFLQGIVHVYGFNLREALRNFQTLVLDYPEVEYYNTIMK